jgi:hypothetical protein
MLLMVVLMASTCFVIFVGEPQRDVVVAVPIVSMKSESSSSYGVGDDSVVLHVLVHQRP